MRVGVGRAAFIGTVLVVVALGCSSESAPAQATVTVVPCEKLRSFLPNLPGWARETTPQCETDTAESVSRVQVDYDKGISRMSVEIMDSSKRPEVQAPLSAMVESTDAEATAQGLIKTKIQDFPAVEEWTPVSGHGEISILVADRFMLRLVGSTVPDIATVREAAEKIDLKGLASVH